MTKREKEKLTKIEDRIASGEILNQKIWQYIMEVNSYSNEQLDKTALIGGDRDYTYRQMFRNWEYYAEVFSALGMTGENHSRVAILAGIGVELTLSFYALNMTGASVSMIPYFSIINEKKMESIFKEEGITDLLIPDTLSPLAGTSHLSLMFIKRILSKKEELGLKNVIILHVPVDGPFADDKMKYEYRSLYERISEIPGIVRMEDLLEEYETTPISYDTKEYSECALIIHTSGTTRGTPKPVPFADRQLNAAVNRFMFLDVTKEFKGNAVSILLFLMSTSYGMIDMLHLPLACGGTVVIIPKDIMEPWLNKAIGYYRMNIFFGGKAAFDKWMNDPGDQAPDLSAMKLIALGGGYISADYKKSCNEYIKEQGGRVRALNGYGITELGGACILSSPDREDDAIGYPMQGVHVKIYDEEEKKFYSIEDGPRIGGLYLSSQSLSSGRIDDHVIFETEEIDGLPYYCTNDLVRVNEDGSLTAMGRMNRFFLHEDGSRFDVGIIEQAVSSRPHIRECAVIAEYSKNNADTLPTLYIKTDNKGKEAVQSIQDALCHVFIKEEHTSSMKLPESAVLIDDIPYNANGKVDLHSLLQIKGKGDRYSIIPLYRHKKLTGLELVPAIDPGKINIDAMRKKIMKDLLSWFE